MKNSFRLLSLAASLSLAFCGPPEGRLLDDGSTEKRTQALDYAVCALPYVVVRNDGRIVFEGEMDLDPEVDRIVKGIHLPYRHDGSVFYNRERRLPAAPHGFYHEYVHPTQGIPGPGPQRLVRAKTGLFNYTPDHYASFWPLSTACGMRMLARIQDN